MAVRGLYADLFFLLVAIPTASGKGPSVGPIVTRVRHLQPLVGHVLTNEYIKHHLTSIHSDRAVKEEITAGILFSFFFIIIRQYMYLRVILIC